MNQDTPLDLYGMTILIVIAIVGMAISFKISIDIEGAAKQLLNLDCWWYQTYAPKEYGDIRHKDDFSRRRAAYNRLQKWHPDLQWRREHKMFWLDKGLKVEITFLIAWLVILSGVIAKPLFKLLCEAKYDYSDGWYGMPVLFALISIIGWWIRYLRTS